MMDVPDFNDRLAVFWNEYTRKNKLTHKQKLEFFERLCEGLYIMIHQDEFSYSIGDPVCRQEHREFLHKARVECFDEMLQDLLSKGGLYRGGH